MVTDAITYRGTSTTTTGQIATFSNSTTGGYSASYSYTYDANGNILSVSDGTNTTSYVYDAANQLIRENNVEEYKTWTYTYDAAGNILTKSTYAYTTGALGTPLDTVNYTYGDSQWGDLLTAYDGQTITYDAIGNPLSDGTWTYTWEHGRQLASMSDGSTTWSYEYDANGLRTKRTNGTKTYEYYYTGGQLTVLKRSGQSSIWFYYDASGTPYALYYEGAYYYYMTNAQGDVVAIVDSNGNPKVYYQYDAWGNELYCTGSMSSTLGNDNPLRYRGYVYDEETGLYYLQSRYYNPQPGRFINIDGYIATGQGILGNNMFTYCNNNPVNMLDPNGEFPWWTLLVLCAVAITGAVHAGTADYRMGPSADKDKDYSDSPPPCDLPSYQGTIPRENPLDSSPSPTLPDLPVPDMGKDEQPLTSQDIDKNTLIGGALGLAAGGGILVIIGAGMAIACAPEAVAVTAIGALSYNVFPMAV